MTLTSVSGVPLQIWHANAACRGLDPKRFFPHTLLELRAAKAICGTCQAREACLATAMADPTLLGVWGETDENERKRARRKPQASTTDAS